MQRQGIFGATILSAILLLSMGQVSNPTRILVQDEGTNAGRVNTLNITGAAATATVSGTTATIDVTGGSGVSDAEYWVGAAHTDLTAEVDLSAVGTGLLINTAGAPSAYAGTSCTNQFPRSLNASGAATCASVGLTSDVTGTLPVANGGMPAGSTVGALAAYNGSAWVTMTPCVTGEFIRWNPGASDGIDCVPGPNVSDQNADATSTSSAAASFLTDMVFAPEPDTWFGVSCTILYQTAATTTGIGIGLFANDIGGTAPAQFFSSKFTIGGFGAAGTDSDWVAHTSSSGALVVTTDVQSATAWYVIKIDALVLTHATDTDAFIAPQFRTEVNLSAVTIKEGSYCKGYALHVDS